MKTKTPNALPPTVISFQTELGIAFTLPGARQIARITVMTIGSKPKRGEPPSNYPYHLIDFWSTQNELIGRSKYLKCNKRDLLHLTRLVTRKLAVYLFENQSVKLEG